MADFFYDSDDVLPASIDGNPGETDTFKVTVVSGSTTVDLSGITFTNWESGGPDDNDRVVIDGAGLAESQTLTGTDFVGVIDIITGGSLDDEIIGFVGDDQVDGGGGTGDKITLDATSPDLNDALDGDIVNVEAVDASSAAAGVEIDLSAQTDAAGFTVTGSAQDDTLTGSAGNDDISGGAGADRLTGGAGVDAVHGGDGDDTLVINGADAVAGETYDGGADTDTLEVSGTANLTGAILVSIEGLKLGSSATFTSDQLGAGLSSTLLVTGTDTHTDTVTIDVAATALTVDLSAWTFAEWKPESPDDDRIVIDGSGLAGAETLTGTSRVDLITGGNGNDTLSGLAGDDEIAGGAGADTITGGGGADTIDGGAGDDKIVGFVGADTVDGGDNTDTITLDGTSTDLNAAANDRIVNVEAVSAALAAAGVVIDLHLQDDGFAITGGARADTIIGSAGDDAIDGGAGADVLTGGAGVDTVRGGTGNDRIEARAADGNDVYDGGEGTDTVDYSATGAGVEIDLTAEDRSGETISGDPTTFAALMLAGGFGNPTTPVGLATGSDIGTDVLVGIENVVGSAGNDTVLGNEFANVIEGGGGADKIWSRGGNDTVRGGDGNDVLVGGFGGKNGGPSGNDTLFGDGGKDELYGENGKDALWGGAGADQYVGGKGRDTLYFEGDRAKDTAWGGDGRDTFVFEGKFGTDTIKDFLAVGKSSDKIDLTAFGSISFKDLKIVQAGGDVEITGLGNGRKIVLEVVNAGALTAKDFIFGDVTRKSGSKKSDVLKGKGGDDVLKGKGGSDTLKGKGGDDLLKGGRGDDTLLGGSGDDILKGDGGDDKLIGGAGSDALTGGGGSDAFVFKSAGDGVDVITDFASGKDWLEIAASGFGGGLVAHAAAPLITLADIAGYVHAGASGTFLFDNAGSDAGMLYWDPTGGSSSDATAIVRIEGSSLLQSDLHIV